MKKRLENKRTSIKAIKGIRHHGNGITEVVRVTGRVTYDDVGKSMRLAVNGDVMLQIALESIADMLEVDYET